MYSKKMLAILALGIASQLVQAEEMEVPEWYNQADRLIGAVSGFKDKLTADKATYESWKNHADSVQPLFDTRNAERRQLANCIRNSFKELERKIAACQESLARKNATIVELRGHVSSLELAIAELNEEIARLEQELADAQAAYDELAEEDAAKAAELIGELQTLKNIYDEMITMRNECRSALQKLYNRTNKYNGNATADYLELAREICGKDFAFSIN